MTVNRIDYYYGYWVTFEDFLKLIEGTENYENYLKAKEEGEDHLFDWECDNLTFSKGLPVNDFLVVRKPSHDVYDIRTKNGESGDFIVGIYLASFDYSDSPYNLPNFNDLLDVHDHHFPSSVRPELITISDDCMCCS